MRGQAGMSPLWLRAILIAARILAAAEVLLALSKSEASRRFDALTREVALLRAENALLRARLLRTPGVRRSRYTMVERLQILWHHPPPRPLAPGDGPRLRGRPCDDSALA